ncbi:LysR substrate-binding domain-containing protein [Opitutales bacterium ASA1]|uniref:LysR family transcriptional regulator n=1 Tax=Congregicoccus parvus TaxID=3081749 RepID=UPI002B31C615|nr:LysR substrate-binding domain-containing protein [Opitutales bacterium ASA1]
MDLQRLKYFVEVARQKHFSRAADVCRVSQPSLSQQIKKLEDELGGRVFERNREKVTLTPLGQDFLRHAQAILAEVQSAEEFVQGVQEDHARTIRIGAIPTIAPYLLPELLAAVQTRVPSARFELLESYSETLTEALMTGRIEFALLSPPTAVDAECDHLVLVRDELLLTLPEGHPLAAAPDLTADRLADERMILLENSHCLAAQAGAFCRELGLEEHLEIRSSQIDTLLGLVESGFGLTFTPAIATKAHRHRRVVHRSLGDPPCSREIRLVWLKRKFLTRSQHSVIEAARHLADGS